MIAQVRPLRPEYAASSLRHLWGVILPDSPRTTTLRRRHYVGGAVRPAGSLRAGWPELDDMLERAGSVVPASRLVTVLTREASARPASAIPGVHRCVIPTARGTAPELFLAILRIVHDDPHAVVAALPAAHLAEHGARVMHYAARAAAAVTVRPDLPLLLAGYPGSRDPEYPWIESGDPLDGLEALGVRAVQRLVHRPSPAQLDGTPNGAALLGSLALVASARTLVALGRRHVPDVMECLEPLEDVVGRPEERLMCEAVWESMPRGSILRDVLPHVAELGVVPMPGAMSGEWARPAWQALAS